MPAAQKCTTAVQTNLQSWVVQAVQMYTQHSQSSANSPGDSSTRQLKEEKVIIEYTVDHKELID